MPANTPIPTKSTGNVLGAGDWNDLVPLNTSAAMYSCSTAWIGAPPANNAPNFQWQAGTFVTGSDAAAHVVVNFSAFPTGVVFCNAWQSDITYLSGMLIPAPSVSGTNGAWTFYFVNTTTGAGIISSSPIHVDFLILGF
jgi:hypothetical protein